MSRTILLTGAAAGLVLGAVLIAALANGDPDHHAGDTTATTATPAAGEGTSTAAAATPTAEPTPVDVRTPAQRRVDQAAAAAGFTEMPYGYPYPHDIVEDACTTMRTPIEGQTASGWLSVNLLRGPEYVTLYRIGFPPLCPEHVATLDTLLAGRAPLDDGTFEVGAGHGKAAPGQWRITTAVSNCYWERTSPGGTILDNQFATHAVAGGITVTIRPGDGSFTTRGCGTWELVR